MSKGLVYLAIFIGSSIGSYLPVLLFHASIFSAWSIVGGLIGSVAAIVLCYRYMQGM